MGTDLQSEFNQRIRYPSLFLQHLVMTQTDKFV